MTEQSWKPLFRSPKSTVTKVLRSPAFIDSRERAAAIIDDPAALRSLADVVETMEHTDAPLSAVADRVAAAVRFLRATADRLDIDAASPPDGRKVRSPPDAETSSAAGRSARERLIVAALHYLITPVDLVPDFRVGGYIDDVLLLSWVFGAAVNELEPFLDDDPDA
ncbi:MAG: DUF1232 domain-containing protein [Propionibacteriales bacterium]|nr:DUF1232 domain-containing protein [Propionibacteriales bacterium]